MRAATLFARRQSRKRNSELIQNVWLESSYPFMLALIFPLYICFEEGSKSLSILLPSSRVDIECWIIKQSAQIHPWLHDSCCHLLLCHNTCRSKRSLVTASPPEPHDNTITWQNCFVLNTEKYGIIRPWQIAQVEALLPGKRVPQFHALTLVAGCLN